MSSPICPRQLIFRRPPWFNHAMTLPAKKLFIKTWGCQMNVYDSNRMADVLSPLGYVQTDRPEGADMVILNTCHIREKATDKVFSDLGRIRAHKEASGGKMLIAVTGCVAQAEGEFIMERAPYVDMVCGPQSYHELPQLVMNATGARPRPEDMVQTRFAVEEKFDRLPNENANQGPAAFLSVQEGCDKFCTFCVVPYTRGAEYSRPVAQVLDEARRMAAQGTRDITLLGQNVNAYHGAHDGQTAGLGDLIAMIAAIDGVERIRYMTSHPSDMDDSLIDAHRDIPQLMPFLHLPVQHGSDRILKAMNRKHDAQKFRDIIARIRRARPDIALSSDFIVGFPGETDDDFAQLLQLVRDIGFASAYSFKYSPRPGTPAANMQGVVRETIKDERLQRLQTMLWDQQLAFNDGFIGRTIDVLPDRKGSRPGQLHARTAWNQSIHVDAGEEFYGKFIPVRVSSASQTSLTAVLATA